jgi:surface protein
MASYRDFLPVVASGDWVRPSDWLPLPTVTVAEQKFVGLHAVFPDGDNVCALLLTTSTGQYQVDWGDGTVTLHNSNTKAEYQYDYSTISASTDTTRGYRQVLVTVTPVSGNILTINFQQRYTARNQAYSTGWLDVIGSFPNASAGQSIMFGGSTVIHSLVEQVTWLTIGNATNCSNMFIFCYSIQSIPLFDTSKVTVINSMFSVTALRTIPLFDFSNVTSMTALFSSCLNLIEIPLFNTSKVTTMTETFRSCTSLATVPLLDTSLVTAFNGTFRFCSGIKSIPALSTASTTISTGVDFDATFATGASSLARCEMVFARTVGFANANLSRTAIVEIFTNLVDRSATTSATITITGNWGVASLTAGDLLIATSKNWVVAT